VNRRSLVLGLLLVACSNAPAQEKGSAKACFAYTAPPGWKPQASKTHADLVLAGPTEFAVGDTQMRDNFIVRFLAAPGSLEDFKTQLLGAMTQGNIDKLIADQASAQPGLPALKSGVPRPEITAMTVGGREAFRVSTTNTLTLGSTPVTMITSTVFAKFGREVVSIGTSFVASRAAEIEPLATAFVASVRFDRCK
jgi:hypothetical protein